MEENSLSYATLRNASYNFVGYVFPIVFAVFVTPVVVHRLGVSQYGIYLLANTIMAFFNLIDLGLSTSLLKFVSEYYGRGEKQNISRLLGAAGLLYIGIGILGFLLFAVIGKWFLFAFNISGGQEHFFIAFLFAGAVFFLNSTSSVYAIVPAALQRYDIANRINLVQSTLTNVAALVLVLSGFQLKAVLASNVAVLLLVLVLFVVSAKRLLPDVSFSYVWNWPELKRAYRFGIATALSGFSINAVGYLDRLIIPIFTGPNQLTYYSLPGNVAQKVGGVTNSLAGMFLPLTSSLSGQGDMETVRRVYVRGFRNLMLITVAVAVPILLFAYKILQYWVGMDFAENGQVVLILVTLTYIPLSLYIPLYNFLIGLGKLRFLFYGSFSMAALNLILLFVLVPQYGIVGAAWAYLISVLPVVYLFALTEKKFLGLSGTWHSLHLPLLGKLLATTALFVPLLYFLVIPLVNSLFSLLIAGPLSVVLFLLMFYGMGFMEHEDEQLLKSFALKFLKLKR